MIRAALVVYLVAALMVAVFLWARDAARSRIVTWR